jgi:hypothetical protein
MRLSPMKAAPLSDDAFALRAIPFSGPIPSPIWPGGVDLDGETFTHRTDIKPDWFKARPVDWHHDLDPTGIVGNPPSQRFRGQRSQIASAVDLHEEEDGWWVTVWKRAGEKRWRLIESLQKAGAVLFGSSEPVYNMIRVNKATGHIDVWPYFRQTLSTSPQNTHSIIRPLKASLDDMMAGGHYPSSAFWDEVLDSLHDLQPDLLRAKAGRTDGRALGEALRDADAQVMRLLALFEQRAVTEVTTHGGSDRL